MNLLPPGKSVPRGTSSAYEVVVPKYSSHLAALKGLVQETSLVAC